MKKIKSGATFREELRTLDAKVSVGGNGKLTASPTDAPAGFAARALVSLDAQNVKLVDENSSFYGLFKPDEYSAFVEFDICHSLPAIAGPAYHTANYTGWHPAALSKSHRSLLYKQTNLHHFIKSYDQNEISRDRIIGCVLMTQYPAEPEGGWKIPQSVEEAVPIHACGTIFKQAEGAMEMLREHKTGKQKWSVSIEMTGKTFAEMGLYFPREKRLVGFLDAPDEVLEAAITKDDCGCICVGKFQGEQLVLCYGGADGEFLCRGVGYTPSPAEPTARITNVQLSGQREQHGNGDAQHGNGGPSASLRFAQDDRLVSSQVYEVEEKPGGIMAMCASSAHTAVATAAVQRRFAGAELVKLWTVGEVRLKDQFWFLRASAEKPVLEIRLSGGKSILKYLHEVTA